RRAVGVAVKKKDEEGIRVQGMAESQILEPKNGNLIDAPTQDIILGLYYLTRTDSLSSVGNTNEKRNTLSLYYETSQLEKDYESGKINFGSPLFIPLSLAREQFAASERQKFLLTTFGK